MDTLPFFYYDILARIIPGAATLAVLWNVPAFPPIAWLVSFTTNADKDWQKIIVPIILVGLCYVIGVLYEVLDYFPDLSKFEGIKVFSQWIDDRAFYWSLCRDVAADTTSPSDFKKFCVDWKEKKEERRALRNQMWDELTYAGGSKPEMALVFAHCHRFQAEQKMFVHLLYPTIIFEAISVHRAIMKASWVPHSKGLYGLAALVLFLYGCRSRSRRRWLQTISFWKIMQCNKGADCETRIEC